MASQFSLGNPEFVSTSQLRAYCENGRTLIRPLSNELRLAGEELHGALKEIRTEGIGPAQARYRARVVSGHLKRSADGIDAAVVSMIRAWLSFERNFINDTPQRSKRHFDLNN